MALCPASSGHWVRAPGGKGSLHWSAYQELRHRVALAWVAFAAKKRRVFASFLVAPRDKFFASLISAVLLHGAGSWPSPHGPVRPVTGLPRVLGHGPLEGTWLEAVRASISWLWGLLDGGTHGRSPGQSGAKVWSGNGARGGASFAERNNRLFRRSSGLAQPASTRASLSSAPPVWRRGPPPRSRRLSGGNNAVHLARRSLTRVNSGRFMHFKTHGRQTDARTTQSGLQCQACLHHFTTHVKLYAATCSILSGADTVYGPPGMHVPPARLWQ